MLLSIETHNSFFGRHILQRIHSVVWALAKEGHAVSRIVAPPEMYSMVEQMIMFGGLYQAGRAMKGEVRLMVLGSEISMVLGKFDSSEAIFESPTDTTEVRRLWEC